MPRSKIEGNLALTGYNDIFKTTTVLFKNASIESVVDMPLENLYPPEFHPFQVIDDESMSQLAISIRQYGVCEPGLARPRPDGGYELLCGNRRKRACEKVGITSMPIIIRELDDDDAIILMCDSNLQQREKLLLSEKAWAYKIKMDALNHKGIKGDKISSEIIAEQSGDSRSQIFRLIRLTELIVGLLDKVDSGKIAFNPAVEISYLSLKEQSEVVSVIESNDIKPSLSQAVKLKKLKQDGKLTTEQIHSVLTGEKPRPTSSEKVTNPYSKFFPSTYSQKQIDDVIIELLTEWKARSAA